jgi:hypothetical protein
MSPEMDILEPLWTIEDLAKHIKKSPAWIYRELADPAEPEKAIPAIKLPRGGWRFDPAAIRQWLQNLAQ